MKRLALHVIFWLVYFIQDSSVNYTWMAPTFAHEPEWKRVGMAMLTTLIVLPSKLLLVYYFINTGLSKIVAGKKHWLYLLPEMLLLLVISIIWYRVSFQYIISPYVYHVAPVDNVFALRGILIAILSIGYVVGIAIAFKLLRLQSQAKVREQLLVKEKLRTELMFLKNQTNPHFLFNTLNNIYALTRKKSDQAPEVVMKLSELLSFMLYEAGKESITIAEEIKVLEDYIALEKIRYNQRLSVRFEKTIDNPSQAVAPLLFLPLVENAFKHGPGEARFDSFVDIRMQLEGDQLTFCIENSMDTTEMKESNGAIGLNNTRRQLQLMYKEHSIDVDTKDHTFKVMITINLDSYGKV
jgi:two-component system, LytTR family, sensor kinase